MALFSDGPDWRELYLAEREETRRLTDTIIRMREAGFTPLPQPRTSPRVPSAGPSLPADVDERLDGLVRQIKAANPDVPDDVAALEARRLAGAILTDA